MSNVRVGILGCANIAEKYAIAAFKSLPHVELIAIASREKSKAEAWGSRHGLEAETYASLIQRSDIDVIYSPLPIGLQEEWVMKAANRGKHIICEKSITYSLESAERMIQVCKEKGVALYENFVPEFHPQHTEILSRIQNGSIGAVREWHGVYGFPPFPPEDIRYNAELKGGALNDCGCYTVFMARKIMNAEPIAVMCVLNKGEHDVDIVGSALLEFPHATALMSFGFDHMYQNAYSVWGSKGIIRTNRAFALPPTHVPVVELITNDGKQELKETIAIPATNQFALSFEYFTNAVAQSDTEKISNMYDRILNQARVLDAMRLSAREGKRVVL